MPQRRHVARAAFSAAAATALLAFAAPAWASSTIPLHTAHKGSTAAGFPTQDCEDERFEDNDLAENQDGWHFVLPGGKESGSFETLSLTFTDGTTEVEIKVPDASDAYPDYFYSTGGKNPRVIHAYVFTPAGWTLVDGSAVISGEAAKFNLSHTCPGTPSSQSPSPTPSTTASPSPSTSTSPTPGESNTPSESGTPTGSTSPSEGTGGSGGGDGELPLTGVATTGIAVTGLVLIGGGVALTALRRRRDRITFTS
ncbi:LPXTG cell wall anchor domain-containing protein [Micromonospora coxensis]|uniref:LPXTG-motif cell wall anchor domain-containing protein n=1 Tax=Micromonospora coxensis TaxID=356852 RepID=A0A1C5JPC3_9ACTN|nr:LPXTG cell wall anchor domain-containing protein [Micromonospora coxensis]SCG71846.1 LPXTG-motif cell wall anchor domain-containing protein [Micromonospora coxensis]